MKVLGNNYPLRVAGRRLFLVLLKGPSNRSWHVVQFYNWRYGGDQFMVILLLRMTTTWGHYV
jgi:hypothetical protein